jgi:hypothetical protein
MHQEPCGFHAAIEGPLNLASADAFLARANELNGLKPQMQRKVAILKNATYADSERLPTGVAFPQSRTAAFAIQATDPSMIGIATMRANWPVWPQISLDIGESGIFVVEMRGGKYWLSHWKSSDSPNLGIVGGVVKCNVAKKSNFEHNRNMLKRLCR